MTRGLDRTLKKKLFFTQGLTEGMLKSEVMSGYRLRKCQFTCKGLLCAFSWVRLTLMSTVQRHTGLKIKLCFSGLSYKKTRKFAYFRSRTYQTCLCFLTNLQPATKWSQNCRLVMPCMIFFCKMEKSNTSTL